MAINRIDGTMLEANLLRQGDDFAVETNLLYFDVANSRIGIGNAAPGTTLEVTGTSTFDNLSISTNTISSDNVDGNIILDPNGVGNVQIGNFTFDADQTVGAGQDNYIMTYDNATGLVSLEAAVGGGNVSNTGTPVDNQLAVWTNATTIEGTATLTYDSTYLKMDDVAPFGLMLTSTSSGVDAKKFSFDNYLGIAGIRFWNDAETTATELVTYQRTGTTATTISHQGNKFIFFPDTTDSGFEIHHNTLELGDPSGGGAASIANPLTSMTTKIAGGQLNLGSWIELNGNSATNANDITLGHGSNIDVFTYDYATGTIQLRSGGATTQAALTIDTNQISTFSEKVIFDASTTANPSLNIPEGVAPTVPNDGDVWVTAAGEYFVRLNGVSVDLAAATSAALGDLTDVVFTTEVDGEILRFNGSNWINNTLTEAGIPRMTVASTAPGSPNEGDYFLDTDTNEVSIYAGGAWEPITYKTELAADAGALTLNGGNF